MTSKLAKLLCSALFLGYTTGTCLCGSYIQKGVQKRQIESLEKQNGNLRGQTQGLILLAVNGSKYVNDLTEKCLESIPPLSLEQACLNDKKCFNEKIIPQIIQRDKEKLNCIRDVHYKFKEAEDLLLRKFPAIKENYQQALRYLNFWEVREN